MKRKEMGQGLVEYALIIVLVAIVVIVAQQFLGQTIGDVFQNVPSCIIDGPCRVYARNDVFTTDAVTPVEFNVAGNDSAENSELDLASVTIIAGSGPINGTLEHVELDQFKYTPYGEGVESFEYRIFNDKERSDTARVWIGIGDYALAFDDFDGTVQNESVSVSVLNNDYAGPERDPATPRVITGPDSGTVEQDASGTAFTYTPALDTEGPDKFEYELCSVGGYCDTAVVTIDVVVSSTAAPASASTTESLNGVRINSQAEPGSAEYMVEKVDLLRDESIELELALEELLSFIGGEALVETLEPSLEYAAASGQVVLYEHLAAIIGAAQSGNYEAIPDLLAELATQTGSLPADVGLKTIAKFLPHAVSACQTLSDAQMPFRTFAEAREAMVLYGAFDEAAAMDEVWDINEPRIEFADQMKPAFFETAETIIEILLESGQTKYVTLAEEMQSELAACGSG